MNIRPGDLVRFEQGARLWPDEARLDVDGSRSLSDPRIVGLVVCPMQQPPCASYFPSFLVLCAGMVGWVRTRDVLGVVQGPGTLGRP